MNEALIWQTLRTCFDPEIPVNIVDPSASCMTCNSLLLLVAVCALM